MSGVKSLCFILAVTSVFSLAKADRVLSDLPPNTVIRGENFPDQLLTIRDSPGVVVEDGRYRGIVLQRSHGGIVRRNVITQRRSSPHQMGPEGILVWGSNLALVEDNVILGRYGKTHGTNDSIQVMPDTANGANGGNLGTDPWWINQHPQNNPGYDYIYGTDLLGRRIHYGYQPERFLRGVTVRRNVCQGSGKAGIFAYNVRDSEFSNNEINDVYDAAITIEHSVDCRLLGNFGTFTAVREPNGLDGGIAVLFLQVRVSLIGNDFPQQHVRWYSNNYPNLDGIVRGNKLHTFAILPKTGDPWVERLYGMSNQFQRVWIVPGILPVQARIL